MMWYYLYGTLLGTVLATKILENEHEVFYIQRGDIMFGAALDVHSFHPTELCGSNLRELDIIYRTEAFAYAVNALNKNSDILSNISVGFAIVDTCSKDITSQAKSLHFIQSKNDYSVICSTGAKPMASIPVVGVLCAGGSRSTMAMSPVLALQRIPLLSFTSSSSLLSDKLKFPYFFRTIPPDAYQARAILSILLHFHWTYFSVLYEEGSYGNEMYKELSIVAQTHDICRAVGIEVKHDADKTSYTFMVKQLAAHPKARAVILMLTQYEAIQILLTAKENGYENYFVWIGTDGWTHNLELFFEYGLGNMDIDVISTNFVAASVPRFEEHFAALTYSETNNPWMKEYVKKMCLENQTCIESKIVEIIKEYKPFMDASLIIDAVSVFAKVADDMLTTTCGSSDVKDNIECIHNHMAFLERLKQIRIIGETGEIFFDANQNGPSRYNIHNIKQLNGTLQNIVVGVWESDGGRLTFNLPVTFRCAILEDENTSPMSQCSTPCESGYKKVTGISKCCWDCVACNSNEISASINNTATCQQCPNTLDYNWPNENKTVCVPIPPFVFSVRHPAGSVIAFCSAFGIFMTIISGIAVCIYRQHPLLQACGIQYVIWGLIGSIFGNYASFTFAMTQNTTNCIISSIGFHFTLTWTYAQLITKSLTIYRRHILKVNERDLGILYMGIMAAIQVNNNLTLPSHYIQG